MQKTREKSTIFFGGFPKGNRHLHESAFPQNPQFDPVAGMVPNCEFYEKDGKYYLTAEGEKYSVLPHKIQSIPYLPSLTFLVSNDEFCCVHLHG
ncbi:MAG: hypothetical protein ISS66_09810 [Desulfobacteraceae bacterium]|nr:hypothetical protein [Desulfobacteraceae bacterium]